MSGVDFMQILGNPLYTLTSVGFEDNLIDVVVIRMLLHKAREQQAAKLEEREAISHWETVDEFEDFNGWSNFRNAA